MSDISVSVSGIGKRYRLARPPTRRNRHRWLVRASRPFSYLASTLRAPLSNETLWALRDISFEVPRGQVLGFIGLNGAGKSTLLKVLSRITEPTEGSARIAGRVGTLLEVGTGFHPELTGRENIYLSGAILGMRHAEISRRFDEIVTFAEVDRFLDTPVKRYSSGMYVRLAFAVAAHLDPEVLLVDEVLAVGDVAFQRKCLGAMGEVARQGRTVLFVSHNMIAVQNLCKRVIWLHGGRLMSDGQPSHVIDRYLSASFASQTEKVWSDPERSPGNEKVRLQRVCVRPHDGSPDAPIAMSTSLQVEVDYWNLVPGARLHVCLHVLDEQQVVAFTTGSNETDPMTRNRPLVAGLHRSVCNLPGDFLNSGLYRILVLILIDSAKIILRCDDVLVFEVRETESRPGGWYGREPGAVRPKLQWSTKCLETLERTDA